MPLGVGEEVAEGDLAEMTHRLHTTIRRIRSQDHRQLIGLGMGLRSKGGDLDSGLGLPQERLEPMWPVTEGKVGNQRIKDCGKITITGKEALLGVEAAGQDFRVLHLLRLVLPGMRAPGLDLRVGDEKVRFRDNGSVFNWIRGVMIMTR